jgi:hypothetical protein
MEISLDNEQWTVRDDTSLIEALAQLSEKSRGKGRIVTSLRIGGRLCTDRDLVPEFLACSGEETGPVEAISTSAADILLKAQDTIEQFGKLLKHEGETMVLLMRSGTIKLSSLDCWLGKLAEYIEIVERSIEMRIPGIPHDSLVPWTEQFIEARGIPDMVRMADLLEYELLPRIGQWGGANPQSMGVH